MQGLCKDSCNDMKRGQTEGHTVCIFKFMRKSILIYCIYIYIYIYIYVPHECVTGVRLHNRIFRLLTGRPVTQPVTPRDTSNKCSSRALFLRVYTVICLLRV